jgi:hypothetical protein
MTAASKVAWAVCILLTSSCASGEVRAPRHQAAYTVTAEELDLMSNAFADAFVARLSIACEHSLRLTDPKAPDGPTRRMDINYLRLISATSMYDIASQADPLGQLFDTVVMTSLQYRHWSAGDRAATAFGPAAGPIIVEAMRLNQVEALRIAGRVLTAAQLTELETQVNAWHEANPNTSFVALVRFNEIANQSGRRLAERVKRGDGMMAPVSLAAEEINRSRRLAERAFFVSKRLPLLLGWYADDVFNRALAKQETQAALTDLSSLNVAVGELTSLSSRLPTILTEQRQAITQDLEAQHQAARQTIAQIKEVVDNGTTLIGQIQQTATSGEELLVKVQQANSEIVQTVDAAERLVRHFAPDQAGTDNASSDTPDLMTVTETLRELTTTLREARELIEQSEKLVGSPLWQARLVDLDTAANSRLAQATVSAHDIARHIAVLAAGLVVLTFACLFGYRYWSHRLSVSLVRQGQNADK